MTGSDENNPGVMGPEIPRGGLSGVGKYSTATTGHNRRALSNINRNIIGAPPYACPVNKRRFSGRNAAICDKNPPMPAHRPITRKFAAQMANMQQPRQELTLETKNSLLPVPEDTTIVEVEDYKVEGCVPISVQHTEAMLEEIYPTVWEDTCSAEEVEMEDVIEEPVIDIDCCDKENPLAVVEYIDDLYDFYKKTEASSCVSPSYMLQQFDINERMRAILIDWLIEVHYKFELMEETLYLTINLIDRFLAVQPVVRKKLQLVGVIGMLLACKYEEVSVPVVEDLIVISDKAYSRKELLEMEKLMINTLQFNLSVPTPYAFMRRFLKAAQADKKLELLSFFMMELSLVEYEMLKFPPSLLAAAAIYTAQCTLRGSRLWSKTSEWHTNYSEGQLLECSRMMATLHQNAATGKLTGVHRKYCTSKFGYAAKTQPANFLLDAQS